MTIALVIVVLIFVAFLAFESERNRQARLAEAAANLDFRKQQLAFEQEYRKALLADKSEDRNIAEKIRQEQMEEWRERLGGPSTDPASQGLRPQGIDPRVGDDRTRDLFGAG